MAPTPETTIRCDAWHHNGLRIWNRFRRQDVVGDGIGDDDLACEFETCLEEPGGSHNGDGVCEIGEDCVEDLTGAVFAKGIVRHGAELLREVMGRRTGDLPEGVSHEVVHADDLVVLPR